MVEENLARAFLRQMAAWGVKTIFGVTGNDILPFLDAMADEDGIRYVGAAHEAGAAFMASYHGKLTGELGVCIASAAGTVNLLEGLADAYMDGAPVLALTGQAATSKIGTQAKQYFNQQGLMRNFAAYSDLVADAPGGLRLLIRAMTQALQRQTVTHLSVPEDLWAKPVQAEPGILPVLVSNKEGRGYLLGDLERAVGLMQKARKPMVLIGNRGRGIGEEIRQLVNVWGAAVVVAQEAKGVVPDDWPGIIGGIGEAWMPSLLPECDCILLIGSATYEESYLPKVAIIQVENLPWHINEIYLWDSLAGDTRHIIRTIAKRLKGYRTDPAWGERVFQEKKHMREIIAADAASNEKPVHPASLMAILNMVVAEDAIIALDIGASNHWFDRDFQATDQVILLSRQWRSMGAGLPAAIAAQLKYPSRQVIVLAGDGSLLMSMGELTTAVKYNLPITIVVINNHLYGLEKDKTLVHGFTPQGLEVNAPDFSHYARACGAQGFMVEEPTQLEAILREATMLGKTAVVDVICRDVRLPYLL
ncbi:MAG: thiamine pyrophosphate-binding protein [Bacillota bacterium]